nr:retrovirus-related Pol polyprotein from transposon TNT 1-94 [Tanacetum cinerariifolium]
MTTSSANNSVFRGFFEKQKLIGPNFIDWYLQLRIVLSIEDKLNYLEQPIPPAPVVPAASRAGASSDYARFSLFLGKTINELHAMLKLHGQTLPKNNAPTLHAIRAEKNATSGAGGLGIFVIELNTILNRSWIYDTGCGTHICNTTQGLRASRKLKPGALSLYVGNGQRKAVKAINAFYLCLPCGLKLVLNNCHYAPSITRGVISVSYLYEDGFVNRFADNTIQVSRNNVVYFSVVPRDGIFEIDLSYSLTNESSIYVVSNKRAKLDLDSALLAFEKCVSCMSEKMAMKPYTHQVEKAKDLLGLIHTDVCGPFKIMSRQGASYFVTFTDDFSRYGYVYLLKHKHEVFETFRVFHKEVENQLGKAIKSLRSDRGGEYMSQEFLDHLKDHGIIAHRTPPYTSQHNGIDYEETFSPVADIRAIRILIAISAYYDYEIWQMVVKTSFLNGYLNEEVYMEQPIGFVNPKYPNWVCKLKRSIYGLKQASRQWNKRFNDEIKKFGFTQNRDEPCVYLKANGSNITFLILYVDDILIMGNNIPMLQGVKSYLGRCFAMKDLGEAAYILGIKIYRDRSRWVSCYTDAGYLTDADDLKSQTGYVFVLNNGVVDWKSVKQSISATSSTEAEYIAAFDASKEAVWVRKFIFRLGVVPTIEEPISVYCYNTRAIDVANESGITKGARHFCAKVHYLCEVIEYGDVKLEKVHTYDNLADLFTKALAFPKHSEHTRNIGMLPASSLM